MQISRRMLIVSISIGTLGLISLSGVADITQPQIQMPVAVLSTKVSQKLVHVSQESPLIMISDKLNSDLFNRPEDESFATDRHQQTVW